MFYDTDIWNNALSWYDTMVWSKSSL